MGPARPRDPTYRGPAGGAWTQNDVRCASTPVTSSAACQITPADQRFIFAGQALSSISASARGRADCRMGPRPATGTASNALREADPLEARVPPPALGGRQPVPSCGRLSLAGMLFGSRPPAGSDPAPAPHQQNTPKQVALDHQGVEPMPVGVSLDPSQEDGVRDRRALVHTAVLFDVAPPTPSAALGQQRTVLTGPNAAF